jgi:hypothetical protein
MAKIQHNKVVSTLPGILEPNTLYYVRVGQGFDLYATNDSGTIVAYPLNKPFVVYKLAALQSNSTTTQTIINGFSHPVQAGKTYQIEFFVFFTTALTSTNIRLSIATPAGSASIFAAVNRASDGTTAYFLGAMTANGDTVTSNASLGASAMPMMLQGYIAPTAAGNFEIRFSSTVAGSAVNLQPGGFLKITEL